METTTQTDELIVWTKPQALEEAKSLFASYDPKFRTVANDQVPAFDKGQVGVVFLSHAEGDSSIEKTLASLRNSKVSSIVFYVPHHSADFAFRVGTMVGRQKVINAEWAFNFPHLRQLLKARNIRAHGRPHGKANSLDLLEARRRLGLSQAQLAFALNVTVRTLQNWEAGKGVSQMAKKTVDLRDLLSRMDDYVIAPEEKAWLASPLEAFRGRRPQQLIAEGRMRDIVIEFDRLSEGQPA